MCYGMWKLYEKQSSVQKDINFFSHHAVTRDFETSVTSQLANSLMSNKAFQFVSSIILLSKVVCNFGNKRKGGQDISAEREIRSRDAMGVEVVTDSPLLGLCHWHIWKSLKNQPEMGNIKIYQSISKDSFNGSIGKNEVSLRSDRSFLILNEFFISSTVPLQHPPRPLSRS